ncbi:uncharacterized protein LOC142170480 [Nicotiana tabacum]|uniref:Uncharacterized protein LOC142170480 n=1 Tax=Nicotiana tabacum TaxID=4097 RepID=A0AC58SU68_TOBAC
MTWLFWNVRGINKRYKQKELKQYLIDNQIRLVGLVETRVKENKAQSIATKVAPKWDRLTNYTEAINRRIWILWDAKSYEVQYIAKAAQLIHCQVTGKLNDMVCMLIVVYGFNTVDQRKTLWSQLEQMAPKIKMSWLICGYFNVVLTTQDRQGNLVTIAELKDFSKYYNNLLLTKIPWKGDYYTWTNNQRGDDIAWSRLDRAIANDEWMMQYGHLNVTYGEPFISDHNHMLIPLRVPRSNIKVPFRFFNIWADHEQFNQIIAQGWAGTMAVGKMRNVCFKLKQLKPVFKQLNSTEFKGVSEKIT